MIQVEPLVQEDIPQAAQFLHDHMGSHFTVEAWKGIFDYPWMEPSTDRGVVAKVDGKIVGVWGCVYSKRAQRPWLGNPSSFYIHHDWRGKGIASRMADHFLQQKDPHYYLLSVSPNAVEIYKHWGFQQLDAVKVVFPSVKSQETSEFFCEHEGFEEKLTAEQRTLYLDHLKMGCRGVLISHRETSELIVLKSFKSKSDKTYSTVVYASGFRFLQEHGQTLATQLMLPGEAYFNVDRRFFSSCPPGGIEEEMRVARYYYSDVFQPHEIQFDYSEVALLGVRP